jgi:cytoskeleton protein RodZ
MSESTDSEAPQQVAAVAGVGAQLAAAREARHLSVADVARQLKLSPWQVEALEADQYERLPGPVFVRGFIRNYARFVELDPTLLLPAAEQRLPKREQPNAELPPSINIPFDTGRKIPWHRYVIVVLALLVPVIIFEFFYQEEKVVIAEAPQVQQLPLELPSPQVVTEADTPITDPVETVAVPEVVKPAVQPPLPKVSVPAEADGHRLIFNFDQDSWVEVRNSAGERIFSQFNAAGTRQTVSGAPPLRLVVGNAVGVRLQVNNKPFDLGPYTEIDVARFTLE